MSIVGKLKRGVKDLATYGPQVALRNVGPKRQMRLRLNGSGHVFVRTHESDFDTIQQVFDHREYDIAKRFPHAHQRLQRRYDQILSEGRKPIIVDAGANIGAASLWFGTCYPAAAIVAIEPEAGNATILRKNLADCPHATILEAAIDAEPGFVAVQNDSLGWAVQTERSDAGLRSVSMEGAFSASGGDEPFIVKIDIEGFEKELFSSNLDWLHRTFCVIIEPHDWMLPGKGTSTSFQRAMAHYDFEIYPHGENLIYVRTG
jgi:FkbM family methyltransferase